MRTGRLRCGRICGRLCDGITFEIAQRLRAKRRASHPFKIRKGRPPRMFSKEAGVAGLKSGHYIVQRKRPRSVGSEAFSKIIPAATYVPTQLPVQYHRPSEA